METSSINATKQQCLILALRGPSGKKLVGALYTDFCIAMTA